jgi:hypothetical protein
MDEQDEKDAACALMEWFESQGINEAAAVMIMVRLIVAIVEATSDNLPERRCGARIVTEMIQEMIEED